VARNWRESKLRAQNGSCFEQPVFTWRYSAALVLLTAATCGRIARQIQLFQSSFHFVRHFDPASFSARQIPLIGLRREYFSFDCFPPQLEGPRALALSARNC